MDLLSLFCTISISGTQQCCVLMCVVCSITGVILVCGVRWCWWWWWWWRRPRTHPSPPSLLPPPSHTGVGCVRSAGSESLPPHRESQRTQGLQKASQDQNQCPHPLHQVRLVPLLCFTLQIQAVWPHSHQGHGVLGWGGKRSYFIQAKKEIKSLMLHPISSYWASSMYALQVALGNCVC